MRYCYAIATCALLLLLPGMAQASLFYSANGLGNLLTYDTAGNLLFSTPLTGSPGTIIALAVQPGTGTLFGDAEWNPAGGSGSGSGTTTTDYLVTINPNSGAVTTIGEIQSGGAAYNLGTTNLAFLANGNLYGAFGAAGISPPNGGDPLYEVDPLDGSITQIGGNLEGGLAGDTGLVQYSTTFGNLYTVDTGSGNRSLLATTSSAALTRSLTFGPNGLLYLIDSAGNLDHFDNGYHLVTGPALVQSPNSNILAYAQDSFSPEPAAFGLLGAGIAGLFVFRKYLR